MHALSCHYIRMFYFQPLQLGRSALLQLLHTLQIPYYLLIVHARQYSTGVVLVIVSPLEIQNQ